MPTSTIHRRQFLRTAAASAGSLLAAPGLVRAGENGASDMPNVVFILIDDLGWKDVGYQASQLYETPHVDRLARSGMRFSDAYAACPDGTTRNAAVSNGIPASPPNAPGNPSVGRSSGCSSNRESTTDSFVLARSNR